MPVQKEIKLLNAAYTNVKAQELLDLLMEDLRACRRASVLFLNVDVVIKLEKDSDLAHIVQEAEYVLADGMPLIWISRLFKTPLKEKVSGSDFIPMLCERAAREKKRIFLAGGGGDTAAQAKEKLEQQYPGIRIVGTYAPPFGFETKQEEINRMNQAILDAKPDILIVCLGCPKQEKYIYGNREKYQVPLSVCAGATIDFLAGNVKRCPSWMSRCGLEWFYRFLQEPRRLFKRYFIDDMKILLLVLKYRRQRQ